MIIHTSCKAEFKTDRNYITSGYWGELFLLRRLGFIFIYWVFPIFVYILWLSFNQFAFNHIIIGMFKEHEQLVFVTQLSIYLGLSQKGFGIVDSD